MLTPEQMRADIPMTLAADLEFAMGALADIAGMSEFEVARRKARRVYALLRSKWPVDARDAVRPAP